jgi:hypothetical protein
LLLGNGHAYDVQNADAQTRINLMKTRVRSFDEFRQLVFEYPPLEQHNAAYRNRGDGTFEAVAEGWGLGREADVAHGMATGDFDRDGDLDVVVSRLNAPVGLFRNTASGPRVAVRLRGPKGNPEGIGAKVTVRPLGSDASSSEAAILEQGAPAQGAPAQGAPEQGVSAQGVPAQTKEVVAGGQYLSDSAAQVVFAVGAAERVRITVRWPGGGRSEVAGGVNRLYEIHAPDAQPVMATDARN